MVGSVHRPWISRLNGFKVLRIMKHGFENVVRKNGDCMFGHGKYTRSINGVNP
jgi:hypothetical protein